MRFLLKLFSFFVILIIIIPGINRSSAAPMPEFVHRYIITGNLEKIDEGLLRIGGSIQISTKIYKDNITYSHDYSASLATLSEEEQFDLVEYPDKSLNLTTASETSIGVIWLVYSNFGTNPIYSFYHITPEEYESNQVRILNFTAPISGESIFYSSFLEQEISIETVNIYSGPDNNITTFYDTKYRVLMGFEIRFRDIRVGEDLFYYIRFILAETNLELPVIESFPTALVVGSITGVVILTISGLIIYRRLRKPKIILKGGLEGRND